MRDAGQLAVFNDHSCSKVRSGGRGLCKGRRYDVRANCYIAKPIGLDNYLKVANVIVNFWLNPAILPQDDENGS